MGKEDFTKIPHGVSGVQDRMNIIWERGVVWHCWPRHRVVLGAHGGLVGVGHPMGCLPPGMRAVSKVLPKAPQWVLARILSPAARLGFLGDLGVTGSNTAQHILTPTPAAGGG